MITYVDTSVLVKLLVEDEDFRNETERLWLESHHVMCSEIGYAEARAALAPIARGGRLDSDGLATAKAQLDELWAQVGVVLIDAPLVRRAGDLAELDGLRGYDAVHLAAALTAEVDVMASADRRLVEAARRHGLAGAGPGPIESEAWGPEESWTDWTDGAD